MSPILGGVLRLGWGRGGWNQNLIWHEGLFVFTGWINKVFLSKVSPAKSKMGGRVIICQPKGPYLIHTPIIFLHTGYILTLFLYRD